MTSSSGYPELPFALPLEDVLPTYLKGGAAHSDAVLSLVGLVSRGAKDGLWLLYPSLDMSRRLEIAESDILDFEKLSAEQSPFGRLGGTRVSVRKNAAIASTRVNTRAAEDEFDLDIRLGAGKSTPKEICEDTVDGTTCGGTCDADCGNITEDCASDACSAGCHPKTPACNVPTDAATCRTICKQHTCAVTCAATCANTCPATCANTCAATCANTCAATCANTCHTCATKCKQPTCPPNCPIETVACTHVTCGNQPACRL